MSEVLLEMQNISKNFGGVHALSNVSLTIHKGEIHALIGENGAGKSTLMKILLGIHARDQGEILFRGNKVNFTSPADALKQGISMIHQEISLIPDMSVAENIWLGREDQFLELGFWLNRRKRLQKTTELLGKLGLHIDPNALVRDLSVAQMQLVEMARAVSYTPSILIMDEPTSALTDQEVELLYKVVRALAADQVAVIFISHKLDEIYRICDRITVLRDGCRITTCACSEMPHSSLINLIVGREVSQLFVRTQVEPGDIVLEVKDLCRAGVCQDVNLKVRKGEVLGICGLMGAGRSEILRAIFGIDKKTGGQIFVNNREIKINHPADALKSGIAMVTEDRLRLGIIQTMSVLQNTTIARFNELCGKLGFYRPSREAKAFSEIATGLSVKYDSPSSPIGSLSGGNQQKVIIGRWMMTNPQVLLLDEPTRGIDVGSKSEIYKLIDELTQRGIGVVMVSSELPEILSLSDNILVVREGRIVHECMRSQATQELLMNYAFGLQT